MAGSTVVGLLKALLTADTSEFQAKMAAASADVQDLAKALGKDLEPRQRAVNNAVRDFLGGQEIRRAEEYAQAIKKISDNGEIASGVAKLTAQDQEKVNRAVGDALNHYRVLGQEAPAHLVKLHTETQKTASFTDQLKAQFAGLGPAFLSSAAGMATGLITVQGLSAGFRALTDFVGDSVKSFLGAEAAAKKVDAALRTAGTFTPELSSQYRKLASEMESLTVNSDDLNSEAIALFTSMGQVGPHEMRRALMAAADLSAGMGKDLLESVMLLSKGIEGNEGALKKLNIEVKEGSTRAEQFDNVMKAVARHFDKRAQSEIETTEGALKQLGNAWDNVKEVVGGIVVQSPAFQFFLTQSNKLLKDQAEAADDATAAFNRYLAKRMERGWALPQAPGAGQDIFLAPDDKPMKDYAKAVEDARKELNLLFKKAPTALKQIQAMQDLNEDWKAFAKSIGLSENAIKLFSRALAENERAADAAGKAVQDAAKYDLALWSDTVKENARAQAEWDREIQQMLAHLADAHATIARVVAASKDLSKLPGQVDLSKLIPMVGPNPLIGFGPASPWYDDPLRDILEKSKGTANEIQVSWTDALDETARGFVDLAHIAGGSMGTVGRSVALAIQQFSALQKNIQNLSGSSGGLASGLVGFVPIVGQMAMAYDYFSKQSDKKYNEIKQKILALGGTPIEKIDAFRNREGDWQGYYKVLQEQLTALEIQARQTADALARTAQVDSALTTLGPATINVVAGLTAKLKPLGDALDELEAKRKKALEGGDTELANKLADQIQQQTAQIGADTQAEFDRLNRITLASFNAYIGQGKSAVEAVSLVGPAIDQLTAAAGRFQLGSTSAYDTLARWRELTTLNAPLLDQISGLNELMSALGTLGALDAGTFADLQAQGVSAFAAMTEAGFSQREAQIQLAPLLENIIRLHEETGLAIDEETQKLIDQAREDGVLKEKQISTNDILKQGLGTIIELLGGKLPDAWTDMADHAKDEAKRIEKECKDLHDALDRELGGLGFNIPVDFNVGPVDFPEMPNVEAPDFDFNVPTLGEGGIVDSPTLAIIGESGPEAVIPLGRAGNIRQLVMMVDRRELGRVMFDAEVDEVRRVGVSTR